MAKRKKSQLSSEGKTELAKTIADKGQSFAKTYANIENSIAKFFRWMSSWLDRLLFNQKYGKVVALVLALLIFAMIDAGEQNGTIFDTSKTSQDIKGIPVSVQVSDQAYEVSGIPETVDATLTGDLNDIQLVKTQKNYQVVADLTDLKEGEHMVELIPKDFSSRIKVTLNPSTIHVTIKKKVSKRFTLGYDFVNISKMDSTFALEDPQFEQGEVVVRASQDTIEQIAFVKALIDVSNVKESGVFESNAEIVAYDQSGARLNVDIMPKTMKTTVNVTTPFKNVPITIVPVGIVPNGKAIASYTLDAQSVEIYGPQSILDSINELPISIPASTLTADISIPMPIILPNGITKSSLKTVNITIKLEDSVTKEQGEVPVQYKNLADTLNFTPVNSSDAYTTVVIKGAQGVLDGITVDQLEVYADFSKITEPGTYDVPLTVSGSNKLAIYELKNATIKVNVINKK